MAQGTARGTTPGLTDAELRATPVPVSMAAPPTGAAIETGGNLAAAATSLAVMDDWDESDRCKVNPIAGQAGVAAGSGASDAKTQRVITATDDPILTALALLLTISDFDAKTGSLTETAPTTDTASSGLNGRLQRVAQRLTSMIALLPTALGANGGLKVEGVASGVAQPVSGTFFQATQPVSEADGANVVLGAKADAKSTATDATAITIMSVLKQISASVQAPPSQAVTGTFWQATQPVSIAATVTVDTELPAAAALADSTSNPTVPAVASFPMVLDQTGVWNRQVSYYAGNALVSQSRAAGTYDAVAVAYGMRSGYIYVTLTTPGSSSLTLIVLDYYTGARICTISAALTVAGLYTYAFGLGATVPAGTTSITQAFSVPLPGRLTIRGVSTNTSTFNIDYEFVP